MKKTIRISVAPGFSAGTMLSAHYVDDKGNIHTMNINGEVINGPLADDVKIFRFQFSENNRVFERTYDLPDPESDKVPSMQQGNDLKKFNFWYNNTDIQQNSGEALKKTGQSFVMTVVEDLEKITYNTLNEKIVVANIVAGMDTNNRRNLCYLFGHNPVGISNNGVFNLLVNFEKGIVMMDANAKRLIEINEGRNNSDVDVTVTIRKAVALGIIEKRKEDGHYYSAATKQMLGMTELDVIDTYMKDKTLYGFIAAEVHKQEHKLSITKDAPVGKKLNKFEEKNLRAKGGRLGIDGSDTMDITVLEKHIAQKESEPASV